MSSSKEKPFLPDLNQNRALWDLVQYSEASATKAVEGKGRPMTDINPTWRMKRMTEMFGPVGLGWGWTIDERWTEEIGQKKYAYVQLTVWYSLDGGKTKILAGPHIGGTDMSQGRDEVWKQSVTDAFGKCVSMIGVAADVYLGLWNDSKYHNVASAAVEVQRNPNLHPDAIAKFEVDLKEQLESVADLERLDDLWKNGVNVRIREIGSVDKAAQNRLISTFSQKKNEIIKREEGRHGSDAGDVPAEEPPAPPPPPPPPPSASKKSPAPDKTAAPSVSADGGKTDGAATSPAEGDADEAPQSIEDANLMVAKVRERLAACADNPQIIKTWIDMGGKKAFLKAMNTKLDAANTVGDVTAIWNNGVSVVAKRIKPTDPEGYKTIFEAVQARNKAILDAEPDDKHKSA